MNSKDPTPKQSFGRPSLRNTTSQTTESQPNTETPTAPSAWSTQPKPTPNMAERLERTEPESESTPPIIALDWDDVPVNLPAVTPSVTEKTKKTEKPAKATIKASVSPPTASENVSVANVPVAATNNTPKTSIKRQKYIDPAPHTPPPPDTHEHRSPVQKSQETRHKRIKKSNNAQKESTPTSSDVARDNSASFENSVALDHSPDKKQAKVSRKTARQNAKSRQHFGALRFWQAMGFSLFSLMLIGMAFLFGVQQNTGRQAFATGEIPQLSFLVAGRDVVYCYYRVPCQDQSQKDNLYQTPNTDTLMLVKTDKDGIKILNIPRDTNVGEFDRENSPSEQKINAQYWLGGPEHLVSSVEEITGEHIDAYAIVRTEYVENVIDALGGLDVNIPKGGIQWVDQAAGINLDLDAGAHHLWGKEAVHYLRVRKGFGDDYGRIDHQKQAIAQLVNRLKTPQGLLALPTIISGVDDGVETNLDPQLMSQIIPQLTGLKLQFATLPTTTIRGTFNLAVDKERLETIWNAKPVWIATEDITSTYITIWDATGKELGPQLRSALMALGFEKIRIETLPARQETSQVFTHGGVKAANHLAELLRLPRLQGERFPVGARGVGILLGTEAGNNFAALLQAYAPNSKPNNRPNSSTQRTSDATSTVANNR